VQRDPDTIKRVTLGGSEIEYSEHGEGEPILLVHAGVFADWFLPMAASHALNGFRVIRVRRAGYGPSVSYVTKNTSQGMHSNTIVRKTLENKANSPGGAEQEYLGSRTPRSCNTRHAGTPRSR
jgi:pimeloyl-ACP methyl ester carboxylesterase